MDIAYKPLVGLLSGAGSRAGSHILDQAMSLASQRATSDSDYPHVLLYNVPFSNSSVSMTESPELYAELKQGVRLLLRSGCKKIFLGCVSLYGYNFELSNYFDAYEAKFPSFFKVLEQSGVSLTDPSTESYPTLILASAEAYRTVFKIEQLADERQRQLSKALQSRINQIIHLVCHEPSRAPEGRFVEVGEQLVDLLLIAESYGYKTVLLGCTELGVAYDHMSVSQKSRSRVRVVSSTEVLARAICTEFMTLPPMY